MSKRIKLLINPSGIDDGISYLVYRHTSAPVPEQEVLMKVNERTVNKRPILLTGDVLTQEPEAPLYFKASEYFMQVPAPKVYIEGQLVPEGDIVLYPKDRRIKINNQTIEPNTTKAITMDYHFLASVVEDDPTVSQVGVVHNGETVVHGMNPPTELNYLFNAATNVLKLSVIRDTTPHKMWYRIRMQDEMTGNISEPTADQQISLAAEDYDISFRLQISKDDKATWQELGMFTGTEFVVTLTDDITDKGHAPIDVLGVRLSGTEASLDVQNPWYEWEYNLRKTHHFRVRGEDSNGQVTPWKEFEQGGVNYKPTAVRIRRKEYNGSPSLYDGYDSLTMWDLTEADVDINEPRLLFVDDHLVAGRIYSYTFFIDDEKGFRSEPFYTVINP